jgi:hypothetical protein
MGRPQDVEDDIHTKGHCGPRSGLHEYLSMPAYYVATSQEAVPA